jgi:preprotein translocase subunit Sec63
MAVLYEFFPQLEGENFRKKLRMALAKCHPDKTANLTLEERLENEEIYKILIELR